MIDHFDIDGNPISLEEWVALFEDMEYRRIGYDTVKGVAGPMLVSTVFLGLNHNWQEMGPPILFETMVFDQSIEGINETNRVRERVGLKGQPPDEALGEEAFQMRYCTKKEAEEGHAAAIKMVESGAIVPTNYEEIEKGRAAMVKREKEEGRSEA